MSNKVDLLGFSFPSLFGFNVFDLFPCACNNNNNNNNNNNKYPNWVSKVEQIHGAIALQKPLKFTTSFSENFDWAPH